MAGKYDAIIIGAGHNGLVTPAIWAGPAGALLVLERRPLVGGLASPKSCGAASRSRRRLRQQPLPQGDHPRPETARSWIRRPGTVSPSSFTPFPDGRSLLLGPDAAMTQREIAKFSPRDAASYPRYEAMLERVADVVEPTLIESPPDLLRPGLRDLWRLWKLGRRFRKLGSAGMAEAIEVLAGLARSFRP